MLLIAGLGNPGQKYTKHRHNIGFVVVDALSKKHGLTSKTEKNAFVYKGTILNTKVLIAQPQTYMNLSGDSIVPLMNYYNIKPEQLLVAHDEVDKNFGILSFQKNRGHGGHNGVANIIDQLKCKNFSRLRIGIGKAQPTKETLLEKTLAAFTTHQRTNSTAHFVLSPFSQKEAQYLEQTWIHKIMEALEHYIEHGIEKTANQYNS